MLEIKIVEDAMLAQKLCKQCGIENTEHKNVMAAFDGQEVIGFSVFAINETSLTLFRIVPEDDILLADGMLRSTLHVAATRGLNNACYDGSMNEQLLNKLKFIKDREKKQLDIDRLFADCCCGK